MSREEVVSAYLDGRISRRTLVRRLVAAGVSAGAAVSYAHLLNPQRAFARNDSDHYPDVEVKIIDEDLDTIISTLDIVTRVHADEDSQLKPLNMFAYWIRKGHPKQYVAGYSGNFIGPDTKRVKLQLDAYWAGKMAQHTRAKIRVEWFGHDAQGQIANGVETHTFHA
jgi:hypothetical protein